MYILEWEAAVTQWHSNALFEPIKIRAKTQSTNHIALYGTVTLKCFIRTNQNSRENLINQSHCFVRYNDIQMDLFQTITNLDLRKNPINQSHCFVRYGTQLQVSRSYFISDKKTHASREVWGQTYFEKTE